MIAIENEDFIVELNVKGAQITSFKNKKLDIEYIWGANKEYWGYSSPTLFPVIGSSHDGQYHFDGQTTTMANHGILRKAHFTLLKNTKDQAVLELVANSKTIKQYPFYFKILIVFSLDFNKLTIEYKIINEGVIDMPFNFGLHPAFNCPIEPEKEFSDYKIKFSSPTKLLGCGPKVNDGIVSEILLDRKLFKKHETFIYHNLNSPYIELTDGKHGVRVSTVGFPITSIWTLNDKKAPFICLEPWLGRAKQVEKDLPFEKRDGIMNVLPGRQRLLSYTIQVY